MKVRKFEFQKSTVYNYADALGFQPLDPMIMQDPVDNTTEILVASNKYPSNELHVWKYY